METIVREINRSYTSIEKGEKEGFDGAVFAEDHIHSVSETVTNKDIHIALSEAVGDLDSHSSLVRTDQEEDNRASLCRRHLFGACWM